MRQYAKKADGFTDVRKRYNPSRKSKNTRARLLRNGKRTARQEGKKQEREIE